MTRRCVPTGNALTLVTRTRVPKKRLNAYLLPINLFAIAHRRLAARDMNVTPPYAKLPQRKNARRTTIVRRTKNAPTAIASTANKILPCRKSGLSAAFFYILFRVRISSLVIARPRQRQNNPLTPPLRPVSCK